MTAASSKAAHDVVLGPVSGVGESAQSRYGATSNVLFDAPRDA
ncbi:hypothetical protein OKW43_003425 [Paraburkholderia sp. WC7.3g]|nr:hypothetical protein [Paraburkholderia podalyriae]